MPEQSYATHRRFDPIYHFGLAALYLIFLGLAVRGAWQGGFNAGTTATLLLAVGLVIHYIKTRDYALRAQDRVIRLEERLRMAAILPEDLRSRINDLSPSQCVGLRFASDAELADLVRQALAEDLTGEAIKKRIKTWRPDVFRV